MLIFDQKQPFLNQKPHENRFLVKIECVQFTESSSGKYIFERVDIFHNSCVKNVDISWNWTFTLILFQMVQKLFSDQKNQPKMG